MSDTYLKAAIEILTMPGGPSCDAVLTAIAALRAHLDVNKPKEQEECTTDSAGPS